MTKPDLVTIEMSRYEKLLLDKAKVDQLVKHQRKIVTELKEILGVLKEAHNDLGKLKLPEVNQRIRSSPPKE